MKPHQLLSGLLVLANLAVAAALVSLVIALNAHWPDLLAVATFGVGLGQIALAGAWLAWGNRPLVVRAGGLLAVALAWIYPIAKCAGDAERAPWWGGLLLLYGLLITMPLAATRLAGYMMTVEGAASSTTTNVRPWQFTVGGVLSLTTLAAMLLGVARHFEFPWHELFATCLFCTISAAGVAVSVFLAFRTSHAWFAVTGPLLMGLALGYALRFTLLPPQPYDALIWMSLSQGATISLAAAVLHVASVRLRRPAARKNSEEQT